MCLSYEQIQSYITTFAQSDERIRAVLLQGCRAAGVHDEYSGYNLLFVVDSVKSVKALLKNTNWLNGLYDTVALRKTTGDSIATLYNNGLSLQVRLRETKAVNINEPTLVWLDKDEKYNDIILPEPMPTMVTRDTFDGLCQTFWWELAGVTTAICRQELPAAVAGLNNARTALFEMLEYSLSSGAEQADVGANYRHMQKLLPAEHWKQLRETYTADDYPALWRAIDAAAELFGTAAGDVAATYDFDYQSHDMSGERVKGLIAFRQEQAAAKIKSVTCAFTGRRPQALPWGTDDGDPRARSFAAEVRDLIEDTYNQGYRNFICGMAQGFDLLVCEQLILLKKTHCPDMIIVAAIPGKDQYKSWEPDQVERYEACLKHCDVKRVLAQFCNAESYHKRNRWMVDNANRLIACWEGEPSGGTGRTVGYADTHGVEIVKIWPST